MTIMMPLWVVEYVRGEKSHITPWLVGQVGGCPTACRMGPSDCPEKSRVKFNGTNWPTCTVCKKLAGQMVRPDTTFKDEAEKHLDMTRHSVSWNVDGWKCNQCDAGRQVPKPEDNEPCCCAPQGPMGRAECCPECHAGPMERIS